MSKVIELLRRRGRASTAEIVREIGLGWAETLSALSALERSGAVKRVEVLDPTKPLATAVWELQSEELKEPSSTLGVVVNLILNPPLLRDVGYILPSCMGLLDSLSYVVSSASKGLRIAMPYVGELMTTLFMQHLQELKKVRLLRVITEDNVSNRRALEPMKVFLPNLEIRYATRVLGGIKVAGAHLKLIIADEELAIVGTFNLTQAHLLVNYDLGLLLKGEVVKHLSAIFDAIWEKVSDGHE
ncbi:MAG: phospholipase D family protein [Acidilobaceae archaeon]